MAATIRQATPADATAMHRVRVAVRENRLVSMSLTDRDYIIAIAETGRGWVAEENGEIVAFVVGNRESGNIWALFVDPAQEGKGHGRRLHDVMVRWLFEQGHERLWLTTEPGTRAERFYRRAGWQRAGEDPPGEVRFELRR